MQQALLDQLRKITEEERKILDGEAEVDRKYLYTPVGSLLWTAVKC